nr:hypothetical protein [Acinetobacter variabilis]
MPFSIMMFEKWESIQHLETHMHSVNMQQHAKATQGAVASVKIRILEAL